MTDREMMAQRLREARVEKGYASAVAAAQAFGWTVSTYTSHENGTRGFGVEEARRYGRALRKNPAWLLALDKVDADDGALHRSNLMVADRLVVKNAVAAGMWRELVEWPSEDWYSIDVGPSPMQGADRFAVRMDGLSMDKVVPPGSNLECLRIKHGLVEPQVGDLVILKRRRHELLELSCKRLEADGDDFILCNESTKPEFGSGAVKVSRSTPAATNKDEASIVGIVNTAQQHHFNRLRR